MAKQLLKLNFEFKAEQPMPIKESLHYGVVGSGDMEVIIEKKDLAGKAKFQVVTPVVGYDQVWEKVLGRFIDESNLGNISVEINDNNATPEVVSIRLRQALAELAAMKA
ncbi:MAG: malonate decarboxylase acyl carrier protein [Deltaproteobacteria bacterium]|jgi:malonate decarboxylase delta subunit|nr:malonate decarboxylase acyl carrier protein [Deltaproteobacteria bacterium]